MDGSPPDGWAYATLAELADVVSGGTPPRGIARYWGGSIPWATPTEISGSEVRYVDSTREYITEAGAVAAGVRLLPVDSVLVTTRATIGAVARARVPLTTNQGFQNLVPRGDTDPAWLFHAVRASRPKLLPLAAGSTFKEVSRESFRRFRLLVPPLHEQRAIAATLDAIDSALEGSQAALAASESLRLALLKELMTHGVPSRHSAWQQLSGGTAPACWSLARLGDLSTIRSGATPKAGAAKYYDGGTIPFARINDMTRAIGLLDHTHLSITPEALAETSAELYPADTVLLTMYGSIGRVARTARPMAANQAIAAFLQPRVQPAFLEYLLTWHGPTLARQAGRTTQSNISGEILQRYKVATPSNQQEVDEIVSAMQAVDVKTAAARDYHARLINTKAAIAAALLEGRVPVVNTGT